MLTPIERLDEDPSYVVKDTETGKLYAVDINRPIVLARDVHPKTPKLIMGPSDFFVHPEEKSLRWQKTAIKGVDAGRLVFVKKDREAFRATIVSRSADAAHAVAIDIEDPTKFEPVKFHITKLAPAVWAYAEYTATIRYQGKVYATLAPFAPTSLGATFGRQHDRGGFYVIDVENRQIQGMYPQSPMMRCRFVDGA